MCLIVRLSQELRPKVQVPYCYSLNTHHLSILSKQGYAKVDMHPPRRVVLVVDCIIQEGQREIVSYSDKADSGCNRTRWGTWPL